MLQTNLTILIVEDNKGDYVLIREYLHEVFSSVTIHHATSLREGIGILEREEVDIVLLDLTLPDAMGLNTFSTLHQQAEQVPVIILTGLEDADLALESLNIGAQDYIVKDDCTPVLLAKSIQYSIERSKIIKHLIKSEEQYKYLFNHNPLPMMALEKTSNKILMVNEAAVLFYGYSETEFLNMDIGNILAKAQKRGDKQTDQNEYRDLQHRKKNGKIIDVEIGEHDIIIEGKNAIITVIHDVTERNKAKEQVRQSEQTFRTISENFPNGAVAVLNDELKILYIAGKEYHVKGVSASYFENTNFISHFHSPEKEKVEENLNRVFAGENAVFEVRHDGLTYIISAVPLYEKNGTVKKILIASQNITQQKRNETEKELLIEELTQNNSDLRQFSYITSHNLRAPLSNLIGLIKLIDINSITDPITSLLLQNFHECTLQLNDTVNDLINVLIIKSNVNAKKERLDVKKVFEKVIHSIKNHLDEKHTVLNLDFSHAKEINFNSTYLESILLNLLTNAVKYSSPNRTPEITVRTEEWEDGVKLYFSDNGLGIDLNRYRDRIFGLYQRFHDHADSKGLGLYIVNSQIRVMGGEIDIQSEVDKGTTFILTFKN